MRYLALIIVLCTVGLFTVYLHQSRLQLRFTTPQQRERSRQLDKDTTKIIQMKYCFWGSKWTLLANLYMVTNGMYVARRWYNDD